MTLPDILLLTAIMATLALIPSTSVALVVTRSATNGFKNGAAVAAGIVLGDLVFVCLALLGMSALAELMGGFFLVIKYLAAAYLIWFGLSLLRSKPSDAVKSVIDAPSLSISFYSGLLVTLGDIKAIFFYASLFPAFVDLAAITAGDIALIVCITVLTVGGIKLVYAYAASKMLYFANRPSLNRGTSMAAGSLMVGTGCYLLVKP